MMSQKFSFSLLFIVAAFYFVDAQTTAVPDFNFENYLETHAADGSIVTIGDATSMGDGVENNGLVFTNRIDTVTLLDVSGLAILDLTGIQDFIALETLFCSNNNLLTLNISSNTSLVSLVCGSNSLTALDLSANLNLETLDCSDNQIQVLDVSSSVQLKSLTASGNQLSSIDISNNTELSSLSVSNNRITGELIVSNNLNLESLYCASNQITNLNLGTNTLLKNLDVSDNALTVLDLSNVNSVPCPDPQTDPVTLCQGSSTINVSNNLLSSLVVANGYNDLVTIFNASDNADLFCIQIDNDFTPNGWIKDDWVYYSDVACVDVYTYVPDDNFEQTLINLGYDDDLDNLVLTANINAVLDLDISNASILDITGIEDFVALEVLDCSNNTINDVDLSNNLALQDINVDNNNIQTLDLESNASLVTINCAGNSISNLSLSTNTALTTLNCSNNNLTSLEVSSNTLLEGLNSSFNQIQSLDVSTNTVLTSLVCNDNNLFALNLNNGNNMSITSFNATNNSNLFCIKVDDVAFANGVAGWQKDAIASYNLDCGTYVPDDNFEQALIDQGIDSDGILNNFVPTTDVNSIAVLDVSGLNIADLTGIEDFVAIQNLNVSNNMLLNLDLSNNTVLQIFDCSMNQIEELDLTVNSALTSLLCGNNALRTLNIKNGNNASLTVFNSTDNPNLYCINVDDAIVGNIPASWQKDAFTTYNGDCANNRFTLIPDTFFEQALIDLGHDDIIDGQVLTASIEHLQTLDVSGESISDLTGIKDFQSLVELDCSGNFLDALDVSDMIYLERLNCSSNYLLTNDINNTNGLFNTTGTVALTELYCTGNNLSDLNTSQNINLVLLDCADNNLDTLDVFGNTLLRELNCSNNNLTDLDVSGNAVLERLNCDSNTLNNLTTVAINNTALISLSCVNNNLSNLQIDNYLALETLNCGSNDLTQLNLFANTALNFLSATNNQISALNLQNNVNLVQVFVSQNSLSQLNVSSNTLLKQLNCGFNEITQLDISQNVLLELLSCTNNQISNLDISSNGNLKEVDCSANTLTDLSLSNDLGSLKRLNVSNNQIEGDIDLTTISISACVYNINQTEFCPETIVINLSNNLFDFVNIQNGINPEISSFNTTVNPNLDCIQVDDANNIPTNWIKDDATSYNEDCNFGETYVPDDNFEQALINLGYDSGPLNDYVLTANIEGISSLDVSGNNINDLTGIEDFIALEVLNCSNNSIVELDLSSNENLLNLDCSENNLTELSIQNNSGLSILNCSGNTIESMDFGNNANLTDLNISNNNFSSFVPSELLMLEVFNCNNNQIVELDFQQNTAILSLNCQSNQLETLNIKNAQNDILLNFNAQSNPALTCIQTDTGNIPSGATWLIDATAQLATECFFGQTYVPDDNFEQALIDLGYDSGALDDYVITEIIEDISFLNISSREISDLTGIQDFVNLASLNISDNLIVDLDLSNNILISNLNISNNLITEINLSFFSNLTSLNVSNNSLTQLSFDNNLSLINLNVSNNFITSLDVSELFGLEDFNCAFNELSSLDLTQNPNLNILFCQSNVLVGDQLNIQNGNNENIQIFNATNNPGLGCILVDDPVAVIANSDGIYDNWSKDDSASYQTICEDADNDGVPNDEDLCPGTEFGATVDLFGCAIINLPNDNFTISITGETCLNSNNGKIRIVAQELYSYTATLTSDDFNEIYNFTNDVDILNLLAGTYTMCIIIDEWPDYESCYTIVITEPNPLEVFASRSAISNNKISLDMSGSSSFNIEFNDEAFTTHNPHIELQLKDGENNLKITTDLECQGSFEKRFFLDNQLLVYPNPFENQFNIYNGVKGEDLMISLYSTFGQLMLNRRMQNNGEAISVDTSSLPTGIYLLKVKTKTNTSSYKIIKR